MINQREINGLQVVDYVNYQPTLEETPIEDFDRYYLDGGMEELSQIINLNVDVTYID